MVSEKQYNVLLYYCYTFISDPKDFHTQHHLFCLSLNLRGRIIIASEGINGTVSGLKSDCQIYMRELKQDERFKTIGFKIDHYDKNVFQKLNVRYKNEIVNTNLAHLKPYEKTGTYLSSQDFKKLKDEEDVILLDVRSKYEYQIGKFKDAITLDIEHFREFRDKIGDIEKYKNKKIITYCTGGVKCEKASAYLLERGFKNVYQLHGGIIKYGIEEQGEGFEGSCYVFDNRVNITVNKVNASVIGRCHICNIKADRIVNCSNPICNLHTIICKKCSITMQGACSEECKNHPQKREHNDRGFYPKKLNGYDPYKSAER